MYFFNFLSHFIFENEKIGFFYEVEFLFIWLWKKIHYSQLKNPLAEIHYFSHKKLLSLIRNFLGISNEWWDRELFGCGVGIEDWRCPGPMTLYEDEDDAIYIRLIIPCLVIHLANHLTILLKTVLNSFLAFSKCLQSLRGAHQNTHFAYTI